MSEQRSDAPSPTQEHQEQSQEQGRWEWIKDRGEYTALVFRHPEGGGNYILTPECEVGDYGLSCEKTIDISDRHARLIAAAPDLLGHLKFAVKLLSALPGFSGTAQVEAMQSAIAKAEGRS